MSVYRFSMTRRGAERPHQMRTSVKVFACSCHFFKSYSTRGRYQYLLPLILVFNNIIIYVDVQYTLCMFYELLTRILVAYAYNIFNGRGYIKILYMYVYTSKYFLHLINFYTSMILHNIVKKSQQYVPCVRH